MTVIVNEMDVVGAPPGEGAPAGPPERGERTSARRIAAEAERARRLRELRSERLRAY